MKYIIANFKSHKTKQEITTYLEELVVEQLQDTKVVLALPFPYLHLLSQSTVTLAAQDVSPFPPGSYTGAVSAVQLADCGVRYCIIGHSERRRYFHETSVEVSNKADELISAKITPIICMGEVEMAKQVATLSESTITKSLFAFENLDDIGGTTTTSKDQIQYQVSQIRDLTKSNSLGILYGGSVNKDNIKTLTGVVDGVLVATASLDPESFSEVVKGFTPHV